MSCKQQQELSRNITSVEITNIITDSTLNIRTLDFNDDYVFYGSNKNIGRHSLKDKKHLKQTLFYNNKPLAFRAIEYINDCLFAISISNPAHLYKLDVNLKNSKLVYQEENEKVFYDSMVFWNTKEGIAIGDPTQDCMSIIITRDAGETWQKLPCNVLPKAKQGEAAFAASNTNIAVIGEKTWVATGGKASRVLYSPDKGKTWQIYNTPIVQGKEATGIYSIDFYDEYNGFAIGGDYTKPNDSIANKIKTNNAGKTWYLVAQNNIPGYRSCVQYLPNSKSNKLVAVGFKGIDVSNNAGKTWEHLSNEPFYTIRFLNDSVAYAAGKSKISRLTFK